MIAGMAELADASDLKSEVLIRRGGSIPPPRTTIMDTPRIEIPQMCQKHQSLLVHQAGYTRNDPWRALIIMSQIALFQAATADSNFHKRLDGKLEDIEKIGCLACFKPDAFGEIVEAAKSHDPGAIKRLGESYVSQMKEK